MKKIILFIIVTWGFLSLIFLAFEPLEEVSALQFLASKAIGIISFLLSILCGYLASKKGLLPDDFSNPEDNEA